jgi:histidinol-phosphate/aromatic aminotransferase/cobyric acid decarboxylase-like protein
VRLDANEAPPNPSPHLGEVVARAVARTALERYPDARARELKARIAERTGARVEELLVGTGSDEVISLLTASLARPRSRAPQPVLLAPTPTFVMYRVTARAHGWKAVEVPLDASWDLDLAAMKRAVEMVQPNVVFVATPNNPTGNRVSGDRLEALALAAADSLVVVDEAYVDFTREGSLRAWRARYPNLAILRTLSKVGPGSGRRGARRGLGRRDRARRGDRARARSGGAGAGRDPGSRRRAERGKLSVGAHRASGGRGRRRAPGAGGARAQLPSFRGEARELASSDRGDSRGERRADRRVAGAGRAVIW